MQFKDWLNIAILLLTVIAIVYGPTVAVRITLKAEQEKEKTRRKYQTFHALMKTRRVTISSDHVSALNVIQTEFHDDDKVIAAYKKYIDNLSIVAPTPRAPGSNDNGLQRFIDERDDVFNELLFEIGKNLGFDFDKRELAKYSYVPQGWLNTEAEQNAIRNLAIELLQGRRPLQVAPFQPSQMESKFPPAPSASSVPKKDL